MVDVQRAAETAASQAKKDKKPLQSLDFQLPSYEMLEEASFIGYNCYRFSLFKNA